MMQLQIRYHLFDLFDNEQDWEENDTTYVYKVIWTRGSNEEFCDLSRFIINEDGIELSSDICMDSFFTSQKEVREKLVREAIHRLKIKSLQENFQYGIKYIGEKGKKKEYDKEKSAVYCCYPHQVRECENGHPSYECDSAAEYDM